MGNTASTLCQEAPATTRASADETKIPVEGSAEIDAGVDVDNSINKDKNEDNGEELPKSEEKVEEEMTVDDEKIHHTLVEKAKKDIILSTAPIDSRFPTVNMAHHCYVAYNEYYKCLHEHGDESASEKCAYYAKIYRSICPSEWIAHWNELRENGTWFGKY